MTYEMMKEPAWLKMLREVHPDPCPNCGEEDWSKTDYLYGDDADGRRGIRIKGRECQVCGHEEAE